MSIIVRSAVVLPGWLVLWLVLVGVEDARHISYYDDNTVQQPIVTRAMRRRICTELCMSGLGGPPCGDDCVDLAPQSLPLQSVPGSVRSYVRRNDTAADGDGDRAAGGRPRTSACPLLCKHQLGYPLCTCDSDDSFSNNRRSSNGHLEGAGGSYDREVAYPPRVDFLEICGFFCIQYDYQLYGCQNCEMFRKFNKSDGGDIANWTISGKIIQEDWQLWCTKKCISGDGGAACNCDLLPMTN